MHTTVVLPNTKSTCISARSLVSKPIEAEFSKVGSRQRTYAAGIASLATLVAILFLFAAFIEGYGTLRRIIGAACVVISVLVFRAAGMFEAHSVRFMKQREAHGEEELSNAAFDSNVAALAGDGVSRERGHCVATPKHEQGLSPNTHDYVVSRYTEAGSQVGRAISTD